MTSAIQLRGNGAASLFDAEAKQVIRDIYAKGASDSEFTALIAVAEARGLDPRMGHCHFVKRWDSKSKREVWAVQPSIDGFRAQAERSGDYDGQDEPEWITDNGEIVAAKVRVYRKGISRPFVGVAYMDEYVQTAKDQQTGQERPTRFWSKMQRTMIAKCAEALAIRKAFPQLGGLYIAEEMMQAENDRQAVVAAVEPVRAALPAPDASALADLLARIAVAPTVDGLKALYKEGAAITPKDSRERQQITDACAARKAQLAPNDDGPKGGGTPKPEAQPSTEAKGSGEPVTGEHEPAPVAWTLDAWRAHAETHTKHFAVANSYAKHERELEASGIADDASDVTIARLIALGLDEAHAVEAIAAACDRRDRKSEGRAA
jgi:phage recombination protein Bet